MTNTSTDVRKILDHLYGEVGALTFNWITYKELFNSSQQRLDLLQQCARYILDKTDSSKLYLWVYELNENAKKVYERLRAVNFETIEKETTDGNKARQCRYTWQDVSVLI